MSVTSPVPRNRPWWVRRGCGGVGCLVAESDVAGGDGSGDVSDECADHPVRGPGGIPVGVECFVEEGEDADAGERVDSGADAVHRPFRCAEAGGDRGEHARVGLVHAQPVQVTETGAVAEGVESALYGEGDVGAVGGADTAGPDPCAERPARVAS